MPGQHLTTNSQILCPHGGQAILFSANTDVLADNAIVLLESDVHPVVGCPFTAGPKYSPCVRIEWTAGAMTATVKGTATLVQSSIGKCINAENAPQGIAIIVNTQLKAAAQ